MRERIRILSGKKTWRQMKWGFVLVDIGRDGHMYLSRAITLMRNAGVAVGAGEVWDVAERGRVYGGARRKVRRLVPR